MSPLEHDDFQLLCRLLQASRDEAVALSIFVASTGLKSLEDVVYINQSVVATSKLSPILQQKILAIAQFVSRKG